MFEIAVVTVTLGVMALVVALAAYNAGYKDGNVAGYFAGYKDGNVAGERTGENTGFVNGWVYANSDASDKVETEPFVSDNPLGWPPTPSYERTGEEWE